MLKSCILKPGHNCWKISRAEKASYLIDANDYFKFLKDSLINSRYQIFILSWDFNSKVKLKHDSNDPYPDTLGRLLINLIKKNRDLNVYILNWDYTFLFAKSREWLLSLKLIWKSPQRLHYKLDGNNAHGACHHQKVVVIDEFVAFCGGLDLTVSRWDTNKHLPHDTRRKSRNNSIPRPYHDVQIALEGAAAKDLGELFRERWLSAGYKNPQFANFTTNSPWPKNLPSNFNNVIVGISRTYRSPTDDRLINEIEQLYVDIIIAAKSYIYIENQYFTSEVIADCLKEKVRDPNGPEIVIVLPLYTQGWAAQRTMDRKRISLIKGLVEADIYNKLDFYYPHVAGLTEENAINIHSKLMIADDEFMVIGSANLNNRSLGMDSECAISIDSYHNNDITPAIKKFLNQLLSEHLGTNLKVVNSMSKKNSLHEMIDILRFTDHSLWRLVPRLNLNGDKHIEAELALADPYKSLNINKIIKYLLQIIRQSIPVKIIISALIFFIIFLIF